MKHRILVQNKSYKNNLSGWNLLTCCKQSTSCPGHDDKTRIHCHELFAQIYIYTNHLSTGRIVYYTHGLHGLTKTNHKNRTYAVRLLRQTTQCCSTRLFHKCCPHARKNLVTACLLLIGSQNLTATSPNTVRVPGCQCPTQTEFQAADHPSTSANQNVPIKQST